MMDCGVPISDSDEKQRQKLRRQNARAARRREEILDAAKSVFVARDYSAVTIDDIAEAGAFSRAIRGAALGGEDSTAPVTS